tara:strand:+ start:780 stop:1811 length:1032 start_codon:yes stop_codon:yes gene_type:complete
MTLSIAIIGAGLVGKRHIDAINNNIRVKLSCIVDPSHESTALATSLDVPHYLSIEQMVDRNKPNGVIIATPNSLHANQVLQCLDHKIPLLVEKPLADTIENAESIVNASLASNVHVLVGHHRRYNPIIRKAKLAIHDGMIGSIQSLHSVCWFYKPDHYFEEADWRKRKGAGPVSVNLVHEIDLVRYLCGEIEGVQATMGDSTRGYENEQIAAAVLQFKNKAIGTLSVGDSIVSPWSWELTSGEYPSYPKTNQSCIQISGDRGALSIPDLTLWQYKGTRDWWNPIHKESLTFVSLDPLIEQIEHFADVIEGKAEPLISASEGFQNMKVIDALFRAAESGVTTKV